MAVQTRLPPAQGPAVSYVAANVTSGDELSAHLENRQSSNILEMQKRLGFVPMGLEPTIVDLLLRYHTIAGIHRRLVTFSATGKNGLRVWVGQRTLAAGTITTSAGGETGVQVGVTSDTTPIAFFSTAFKPVVIVRAQRNGKIDDMWTKKKQVVLTAGIWTVDYIARMQGGTANSNDEDAKINLLAVQYL